MKKMIFLWLLAIVLMFLGLYELNSYAHSPEPKSTNKDLRKFLEVVPNHIYNEYGYSEETLILYNISRVRAACLEYEKRIKVLEFQVAELQKPIDPNEVKE